MRASYNDETALIVKQLTSLGLKKIAVFYQNDAYGKAGFDGVTLALAARLLVEGLQRAGGKLTRDSLVSGLEAIGNQVVGGFAVSFSGTNHVASKFVELSMLTGDGRVRT